MKLTINMGLQRLSSPDSVEVSEFSDFLLRVGEGTEAHNEDNMVHIDEKFIVRGETFADFATTIYSDIKENYQNRDNITSRIKNDTTDQIHQFVMNQIPGEAKILLSADSVDSNQAAMYPTEFLNSITLASLPPHRLYLKKYASVILLRSLDPTQGLCNGSRLTIIEISSHVIDAEIATGTHRGNLA